VCFAGWNVTLFEGDPSPPVLHCHRRMLFRHEATCRYVGFFHSSNFCYCYDYYNDDLYLIIIWWFWFFLCPPFYERSCKRQWCWAGCTNRYMERTGGITGGPALSCFCLSIQQMISYFVWKDRCLAWPTDSWWHECNLYLICASLLHAIVQSWSFNSWWMQLALMCLDLVLALLDTESTKMCCIVSQSAASAAACVKWINVLNHLLAIKWHNWSACTTLLLDDPTASMYSVV